MVNMISLLLVLTAIVECGYASAATGQEPQHFSPKGKMPSKFTIELQEEQRKTLPFADKQDFDEAKRGFIAAPPYRKIMNDKGGVDWDIDNWNFLLEGKDYNSIHPSLQRQALLNMEYGLFEVVPGIYQVRGFAGPFHHVRRGARGLLGERSCSGQVLQPILILHFIE